MIKAVIFDMDGVLVNSEPLWKIAEYEVFSSLGVPVTKELINETSALTINEVCNYWYNIHPWNNVSLKEVEKIIVDRVIELIKTNDIKIEGVKEALRFFKEKNIKIGLASNSSHDLIDEVLNCNGFKKYFDFIASAEDVTKGKPNPDVYLYCAKKLTVLPNECIVFEDSVIGLKSALDAGMYVITVPAAEDYDKVDFDSAHFKIPNLKHINSIFKLFQLK